MKTDEQRLQSLEEVAEASRHVFRQMTDIAQSDGAPVIQEWGLIDRLGKALAELGGDESGERIAALREKIRKHHDWMKGDDNNDAYYGIHKGHTIEIERQGDEPYYITVIAADGSYAYDGYAPDTISTIRDAKAEALRGAMIN